mmetsp:Transcript_7502/g.17020  ORF Transcript_7502/g.17020 Transcript_7502/m.17020 type:complete len:146 (-) Transcript_7502:327-764(-)|eukprot:CAMPEP_0172310466 /NCGR_PEP_ID=MMETSP1058-20130122/11500_1 /TAXON_ID=83371 /ORGANISM="Detonula confervacea, Strain CCMP 353" /LENGTH=145 /DNA_ID=CAMNT_0013023273 /DNA_START=71 /DNA_END=508 /DNA_ORIENTATION=+
MAESNDHPSLRHQEQNIHQKSRDTFGLKSKTKITNASSETIYVVVDMQPTSVTIHTKIEAGLSVPYIHVNAGWELETNRGARPPQEAVILSGSAEKFELPHTEYYLTIFTKKADGTYVIREKNRLVRSSQNWIFEEADLTKEFPL